jgi:hypothetical protein
MCVDLLARNKSRQLARGGYIENNFGYGQMLALFIFFLSYFDVFTLCDVGGQNLPPLN